MTTPVGNNTQSVKSFPQEYLDGCAKKLLEDDKKFGNGDGKVDVNEAYKKLDIPSLFENQNEADTAKLKASSASIQEALKKYAGKDGVFSAQEWAEFLNGEEWDAVMKDWHASGGKALLEMKWIDDANNKDGKVSKGEVSSGLINNLVANGSKLSALSNESDLIDKLISKYAGEDGVFTLEEYQALRRDKDYASFVEKNWISPWFSFKNQAPEKN